MVVLGLILLLLGLFVAIKVLFWLGLILLVVGLVLNFGPVGTGDGSRRRYW